MPGPYTLSAPLKVGGGQITELVVRRAERHRDVPRQQAHRGLEQSPRPRCCSRARSSPAIAGLKQTDQLGELPVSDLLAASDQIIRCFSDQVEAFNPDEASSICRSATP